MALIALLPTGILLADDSESPPRLQHNPFARPASELVRQMPSEPGRDSGTSLLPDLQATMIGSKNKLANVGGRILKRGDEVEGYVLVAIHEQFVVFRKNGQDTTVYVKPLADDDE
jgi:hypothetical protein